MSDVYCVSYDAAKVLRRAGGDLAWVRRLEDFRGTEEDARRAVTVLEEQGQGWRAEGLRGLLPPVPPPPPPPPSPAPSPDVTMTFWRRRLLRCIARGDQPLTSSEVSAVETLMGAGLVALSEGDRYVVTAEGEAYLAAHDETMTRRTERPGPPSPPKGWSVVDESPLPIRWWRFEGRFLAHVELCVDIDSTDRALDEREEACTSVIELIRYFRALRAYQSREARDGAAPAPPAAPVDGARVGDGEGRPEEHLCTSEVSP